MNVVAAASMVDTRGTSVGQLIEEKQIVNLPLSSRASLDFVRFLPGVNSPGGTRDSTINGLPQSSVNITLDGMNIQDNYAKSWDGMFTRVSPRLDAVEAILEGYTHGTRYGIRADADGLLASGEAGVQLTWMDAKVGDWVVTPRIGKPVEINALWFNALAAMAGLAQRPLLLTVMAVLHTFRGYSLFAYSSLFDSPNTATDKQDEATRERRELVRKAARGVK